MRNCSSQIRLSRSRWLRRLVEQHGVGPHQQDARQRNAHLPAARQRADVAVHHLLAEAEAGEHLAGAAFQRVAAELLEAALHLAVARHDVVHVVGARRVGHGGFELLQLGRDRAHRAGAVHHLGHRATARHLADVLAEVADGDAAVDRDLALVGLLLAGDHAEQRGLAGAVGADQADLLAAVERGRGFDEQEMVAVLLADVVEADHGTCGDRNAGRCYAMRRAAGKRFPRPQSFEGRNSEAYCATVCATAPGLGGLRSANPPCAANPPHAPWRGPTRCPACHSSMLRPARLRRGPACRAGCRPRRRGSPRSARSR